MKLLAIALVTITTLVINLYTDMHIDGSQADKGWDAASTWMVLLLTAAAIAEYVVAFMKRNDK